MFISSNFPVTQDAGNEALNFLIGPTAAKINVVVEPLSKPTKLCLLNQCVSSDAAEDAMESLNVPGYFVIEVI